jgi:hypothetical protein
MARSAVLNVQVLVDAAKAAGELNQTAAKFESWGKKLGNAVIAAVAVKGVTDLAKTVVSSASQMEQAMGGTDKVFGSSAADIHNWAKDTTDAVRLPAAAVEKYAVLIKTQLAATGQPMGALVTQTKALIQVGADLAAVTGADLADSIGAVKSALAGEYDPIQNLGVAITGTTVNLKALEIAHGDTALAATSAVVAQARVAEIMEKSAFATGAAAEESDTFQAKVDSLKETASSLAVAIGGPMLDSLAGMVGGMSDVATSASTLGTGLGTILGSILSLPAPIQAVVVGLVALVAVSAKWGTAVTTGLTTMMSTFKSATSSASGFKAALSGIGSAMAGGALLLGVGAIIAAIAIAIGRVTEAANKGKAALSGYVSALVESGNKSTDASAKAFKEALLASDAFAELVKDGFTANEAVGILSGTMENWHDVMSGSLGGGIRDLNRDTMALVDGFIDANGEAGGLAQAQIDGAAAMGLNAESTDGATEALDANAQAAADAEAASKLLASALDQAKAAAEASEGNQWLNSIATDAENAKRAIDILQVAIDRTTGNNRDYQASQAAVNATILAIPGAFKLAEGAVAANSDALKTWNVQALTTTEAGQTQYQAIQDVADAYTDSTGMAYQNALATHSAADAMGIAREQAQNSREQFINMHDAMGLTAAEAVELANKVGILDATQLDDKTFQVIAADADARAKVAELQRLGVDPKTITFSADVNPAMEGFQGTLSYIDTVTGQPKNITIGADTAPVQPAVDAAAAAAAGTTATMPIGGDAGAAIGDAQGAANTISGTEAQITVTGLTGPAIDALSRLTSAKYSTTVDVQANPAPANGQINAVANAKRITTIDVMANASMAVSTITALTSAQRSTTIVVNANATAALQTIGNVVNSHYSANVTVGADTGPARSAISAVTNGSYTATITVTANVSQAQAAIAAIPRSVAVSAPAPKPPAPAPAGFSAFSTMAAPTLQTPSPIKRSLTVPASIVINVKGGLDSADEIGRRIETVMRRYDRRRSGIVMNSSVLRAGT